MDSSYASFTPTRKPLIGTCASLLGVLLLSSSADAFGSPIFQETATLRRTAPSKTEGVEIELPDFDEFLGRVQAVSPLARLAIQGGGSGEGGGFAALEDDTGEFLIHGLYHCLTIYIPFQESWKDMAL